ncbi:hypothetical protein FRB94_005716 [Tulasnella sp. JGI-2019a]|nr:hypothetical protein FRB93_003731 [Tulasnella sp. JGI-2019a]KAG9000033.1 hypothetical protein FRB94_005716 [Tulasnella sp. JGI-2019a]
MFRYKANADEPAKQAVAKALQTQCVSTLTGEPYIRSLKGGMNYSEAGLDKGFEHAFVLDFPLKQIESTIITRILLILHSKCVCYDLDDNHLGQGPTDSGEN